MFRIHRLTLVVGAVLTLFGVLPWAQPAHAQDKVCFPQTNQCIEGRFLQYWQQNGGLAVFGYPIAPARQERNRDTGKTYLTQWFERNRFELHPENARPYDVLLGLLGNDRLLQQGRTAQSFPTANPAAAHYFPQTQHAITNEPFWRYWSTHGLEFDGRPGVSFAESLALFGYPVSEPALETNTSGDRVLTQWFERARFEFHPNNPPAFQVLLGLLGNELRGQGITPTADDVPAAVQQPILDAAYAAVRATHPRARLAVGLIDIVDDYAAALATPFGQRPLFVYLQRRGTGWQVIEATTIPSAAVLRQRGVPEELLRASDRSAVIDLALARLQDPRGEGVNAYVTRPRVAGTWARLWIVPGTGHALDPATQFYRRAGAAWRFETGGTAFPEDQLRDMGVPRELWPYGESVRGPQA